MISAPKVSYEISSRYAKALISLASEAKLLEKVEADLTSFENMISNSEDLARLLYAPSSKKSDQRDTILELAKKAKFQDLTKNFLGVLVQNNRINAVKGIIDAVQKELAEQRGEVEVEVITAQDMTPSQIKALEDALKGSVGAKVAIKAKVEPGILGGMIVTVGSQMIDDSVRRKLERLQTAMSRQANENTNQNTQKEVG